MYCTEGAGAQLGTVCGKLSHGFAEYLPVSWKHSLICPSIRSHVLISKMTQEIEMLHINDKTSEN